MVELAFNDYTPAIVETYDLPPPLSRKIGLVTRAIVHSSLVSLSTYAEQYRLVANLVDSYTTPYSERFRRPRLQQSSEYLAFHELLEQEALVSSNPQDNGHYNSLSLGNLVNIIHPLMDGKKRHLLTLFLSHIDSDVAQRPLPLSYEDILTDLSRINHRLEELVEKYDFRGRLMIPRRPIVQIHFDPLTLRFRPRQYNKNPLAFFKENAEAYLGLTRTDLAKRDSGLYRALRVHGGLEDAIPEVRGKPTPMDETPLEYFLAHYDAYKDLTRTDLAKRHKRLYNALLTKRELAMAIPQAHRPRSNDADKQTIITAYEDTHDLVATSELTGYAVRTLTRYLKRWGYTLPNGAWTLYRPTRERVVITEEKRLEIEQAYTLFNGNSVKAADVLGVSSPTVRRYWKQKGYRINKKGKR